MMEMKMKSTTSHLLLRRLCTANSSAPKPASSDDPATLLRQHLLSLPSNRGKVAEILQRHFIDGRRLGMARLNRCMWHLRFAKRYHPCLQIFEWMDKSGYNNYGYKDHGFRIDIIFKTKGVEAAEKYFESLPAEAKNQFTYGPLLNGYCAKRMADKASALFEEMDKLGYLTTLAYNSMMMLALTTGEPEKVPRLVEEMKRKGIPLNSYSFSVLTRRCKLVNDVKGVEKAIKMGGIDSYWTVYSNLAARHIGAANFEKAETSLKRLEKSLKNLRGRDHTPYNQLISSYAAIGNLAAVNRVWDSLQSRIQTMYNLSYLQMLKSLDKLGQTDQFQTCFDEWKAGCRRFDLRVVTVVMHSYLHHNRIEEAEQLFNNAVEKTGSRYFRGREMLISHFLDKREIILALRHLRAVIDALKENDRWRPDAKNVSAFLKYFEEEKDVDGAEEFSELLRKVKCLDSTAYVSLLGIYAASGKTAPKIREMMKEDGIEITGEHEILLKKVCPCPEKVLFSLSDDAT